MGPSPWAMWAASALALFVPMMIPKKLPGATVIFPLPVSYVQKPVPSQLAPRLRGPPMLWQRPWGGGQPSPLHGGGGQPSPLHGGGGQPSPLHGGGGQPSPLHGAEATESTRARPTTRNSR